MKTYFRENLKKCTNLIGSFDGVSDEYNITLEPSSKWDCTIIGNTAECLNATTISFNDGSKGWVSFKSFIPLTAVSVNDKYYSAKESNVWEHYHDVASRNNFYGVQYESEVEVLFNDQPGSVKSFTATNYEGSQARIDQFTTQTVLDAAGNTIVANDGENYNEFIEKENKWFNYIHGDTLVFSNTSTSNNNLDVKEISVQGLGFPLINPTDTQIEENIIVQGVDADNNPL